MAKNLKNGDLISFDLTKQLQFIRHLGKGGTGDVKLFFDPVADKYFAIKKYSPPSEKEEEYFQRFINEMKILLDVNHPNIVRVYNYYLYPSTFHGYLQMEYVEGINIEEYLHTHPEMYNEMFEKAINAFVYLESKKILHRDIRPNNLLVANDDLKIIDFGFGKKINTSEEENSIILNWPFSDVPEEVKVGNYDEATEVFYLGSLFKKLYNEKFIQYKNIIKKMTNPLLSARYKTFNDVKNDMDNELFSQIDFSDNDKNVYISFADAISNSLIKHSNSVVFNDDETIIDNLKNLIIKSALETEVQGNNSVISCFISNTYTYKAKNIFKTIVIKDFFELLIDSTKEKRNIIIQNVKSRISNIKVEYDYELPF